MDSRFRPPIGEKVLVADLFQLVAGAGSSHAVEELPLRIDGETNKIKKFFKPGDLPFLGDHRIGEGIVEGTDIIVDIGMCGAVHILPVLQLSNLLKNPGITNGRPANHDTGRPGGLL